MPVHIVDDEQRRYRPAIPMRPSGSGDAGVSAALALLDDVHRHRLRRAALHLPPARRARRCSERDPSQFSDRLLSQFCPALGAERAGAHYGRAAARTGAARSRRF